MEDEIKEMLQEIKETVDDYLKIYKLEDDMMYDTINYKASQWYALLDYITNLQQKVENQRQELVSLNDRLKEVKKSNGFLKQENERLKEWKEDLLNENIELENIRKEAIEYINFMINHYKEQLKTPIEDTYFNNDTNRKGYILSIIAYLETLLITLKGVGKDE